LTPLPSSIGWGSNPRPPRCELSTLPLDQSQARINFRYILWNLCTSRFMQKTTLEWKVILILKTFRQKQFHLDAFSAQRNFYWKQGLSGKGIYRNKHKKHKKRDQVSIPSMFYEQVLHAQIPKAQKRQSNHQSFWWFWDLCM